MKLIRYILLFILVLNSKFFFAQAWVGVNSGLNNYGFRLLKYHSNLYATTTNVSFWDGMTWTSLPNNSNISYVYSISDFNDTLYIGGKSTITSSTPILKYNGTNWISVGGTQGIIGHPSGASSQTSLIFNSKLIIAGRFSNVGSKSINNVASWDGSKWDSLSSGLDDKVYNLCNYSGSLIATGDFIKSGSTPIKYVAQWNGISWQPITSLYTFKTGGVKPITSFNSKLIIGNVFDTISTVPMKGIAVWDGISFTSMGSNIFTSVNSFWIYNSELFCGASTNSVSAGGSDYVYKWNGSNWQQIGNAFDGIILAMEDYGADLFCSGTFQNCSGNATQYVAKINLPISVQEYSKNDFIRVFPNPALNRLNISSTNHYLELSEIEIENYLGQIVLTMSFANQIDISNLSKGYYILRVIASDKHQFNSKFIKE